MPQDAELLTAAKVEALLSADLRALTRPTALRELLGQVAASLRAAEDTTRQLHADVGRIAGSRAAARNPLAAAVGALGALSADEQAQVLDVWANQLVAAVHTAQADTRHQSLAAISAISRTKMAMAKVVEHPDTPAHVRELAIAAWQSMPDLSIRADTQWDLNPGSATGFTVPPAVDLAAKPGDQGPQSHSLDALFDAPVQTQQVHEAVHQAGDHPPAQTAAGAPRHAPADPAPGRDAAAPGTGRNPVPPSAPAPSDTLIDDHKSPASAGTPTRAVPAVAAPPTPMSTPARPLAEHATTEATPRPQPTGGAPTTPGNAIPAAATHSVDQARVDLDELLARRRNQHAPIPMGPGARPMGMGPEARPRHDDTVERS